MNRALFLDRDGVINEDYGYVHKIEDFHCREGIFDVCIAAQKKRMKIIVVTNQAGIGRGYYGRSDYEKVSEHMIGLFIANRIDISGVYDCPFHPFHGLGQYKQSSFDRKPFPGMLVKACNEHHINPFHSIMVGDNESDRVASASVGIRIYISAKARDWSNKCIEAIRSI